jgi:hypothetical protein
VLPMSNVYMKVVDDDGERDEPMFGCDVAATVVTEGGPLECKALFPLGSSDAVEFFIRAQVAANEPTPE